MMVVKLENIGTRCSECPFKRACKYASPEVRGCALKHHLMEKALAYEQKWRAFLFDEYLKQRKMKEDAKRSIRGSSVLLCEM